MVRQVVGNVVNQVGYIIVKQIGDTICTVVRQIDDTTWIRRQVGDPKLREVAVLTQSETGW